MKNGLIGFILGALVFGIVMYKAAPGMMMVENKSKYGFDETVAKIEAACAADGWKIPKIHRLDKSVSKIDSTVLPVAVIELCKPIHAVQVLLNDEDKIVSSMMPCRVAIYEKKNGDVIISRMNTGLVAGLFGDVVANTMDHATTDTEAIFKSVIAEKFV